jgi:hypothetical protein
MAQLRVASRASFRSERVRVAALLSISVTVRALREDRASADRLAAELGRYTTDAEILDLAAALDRYPDEDTAEIREILADRVRCG